MKKFTSIFSIALVMLSALAFTSCDRMEDMAMSDTLQGIWGGTLQSTYYDDLGYPVGNDQYLTIFRFDRQTATKGTGVEIDVIGNRRGYGRFDWEVRNQTAYLYYEDGTRAIIYDYTLDDYHFEGYIDDGTHRDIYFNLSFMSDRDFNSYYDDYYDTYYNWAKSNRTRAGSEESVLMKKGKLFFDKDSLNALKSK